MALVRPPTWSERPSSGQPASESWCVSGREGTPLRESWAEMPRPLGGWPLCCVTRRAVVKRTMMTCAVTTCVCLWETKPAEENLLVNIGNRGLTCRGTPLSCANHRTQRSPESRTKRRGGEGARQPVDGRRRRRGPERARRRRRRHRATLTARPSPPPHAAQRPRKGRGRKQKGNFGQ